MTDLFLWFAATHGGSARLYWPDPDADPDRSDPILLEAEMDRWTGETVLDLGEPWLLATAAAREAIGEAGLTGVRAILMPSLRYSDEREARTRLGEFEHRELPPFFVLRVLTTLSVHNLNGEDQSWSLGDQLRFSGWSGDDFNCSNQGFVVSDRARLVLRAIGIPDVRFHSMGPR